LLFYRVAVKNHPEAGVEMNVAEHADERSAEDTNTAEGAS
jgi:hypothetical protein